MDSNGRLHFLTAITSIGWTIDHLRQYAPSWSLVPPLLIALTGLIGALNSYRTGMQDRRHKEELHRLQLKTKDTFAGLTGLRPLDSHLN